MRRLTILCLFLLAVSLQALSQTTPDTKPRILFAGVALFPSGHPQIQGFGGVALPLEATGRVFSFTDWDVAALPGDPIVGQKFTIPKLQYSIREGLAVKIYEIANGVNLYGLANAGIAVDGSNIVGSFAGGGFFDFAFGKGWGALLVLEVNRNSNVGNDFVPRIAVRKVF